MMRERLSSTAGILRRDTLATHPYTSGQGALVKAFDQFRKAFPPVVDASTLKRFDIAPANESYVINIFRFLGLIDEDGKKVDGTSDIFFAGEDAFKAGLEALLTSAYSELFEEHGDTAWTESRNVLATWFRVKDRTSDLIGGRQASTFITLAALAGHGEPLKSAPASSPSKAKSPSKKQPQAKRATEPVGIRMEQDAQSSKPSTVPAELPTERVGLTVRIEVNLPATGTAEVYDAIFASIRKNLIDG
jgi:hypothetical protein